ncbi:diaminopimelate decarboxylase [Blastococcus sp. DSM 46786]|uniref:diaminopimelate decarboxylase n=1 Tax=Blastococcus sp. DSM 46786 TaxID=1798227 RepID=UPI0008D144BC|nr:diaminopimelate decarboxylase [Blastococcus sp. DSM 46786]SEM01609.1 diaminopimelate decarboxylase [Blastococcus sp. DSM 46786]
MTHPPGTPSSPDAIDGPVVAEVAERYGTPVWLYNAERIRTQIDLLRQFDTIRFAQKASSNIHILRLMRQEGVLVDAVSSGEVARALAAGYTTDGNEDPIVFTADLLDRHTLRRVVDLGIPVNVGSPQMIEQIGETSPGHPVWIRVNPGFGHGHSRKTNTGGEASKHGIWHEDLPHAVASVDRYGLDLIGLHMHIGSGADYGHLERVCESMVRDAKRIDHDIRAISAGGGLTVRETLADPVVDTDRYFRLWDDARKELAAHLGHHVRLEIEPGRFLVANSGVLVAEVRAFKRMGSNRFVLVDAGFNDLIRPALYGSSHGTEVITREGHRPDEEESATVLAGPLCESGDVFTQSPEGEVQRIALPPVVVGDFIVFTNTGAYGASMSSNYNSRPLAPEVLIDGDAVRLIRRRQTMDELLALETDVD